MVNGPFPDSHPMRSMNPSNAITLGAFFKFDSQPGGEMAFIRADNGYQLGLSGSNTIRNLVNPGAWTSSYDTPFTFGTDWRFMAMTYDSSADGDNYLWYVDSTVVMDTPLSPGISVPSGSVNIGHWGSWFGTQYFNGKLMSLFIYNRALPSSELATIRSEYTGR